MKVGENMEKEYLILKCKKCRKTTFVLYREVDFNGFLVCSHCSSKSVKVVGSTDDARECMGHAVYKREKGCYEANKVISVYTNNGRCFFYT